jgi:Phage integrase, N-terminal SAM-like domain
VVIRVRLRPLPWCSDEEAAWRYVEFFTANIRNPNTRRAYARACNRFFGWCEDRGLVPAAIRPHDVAIYVEELQLEVSAPSVKQQLAAIRIATVEGPQVTLQRSLVGLSLAGLASKPRFITHRVRIVRLRSWTLGCRPPGRRGALRGHAMRPTKWADAGWPGIRSDTSGGGFRFDLLLLLRLRRLGQRDR